jgi:hypothetical protein
MQQPDEPNPCFAPGTKIVTHCQGSASFHNLTGRIVKWDEYAGRYHVLLEGVRAPLLFNASQLRIPDENPHLPIFSAWTVETCAHRGC